MFEDSGFVNPEESYYVPLENVTNTKKQDFQTMINLGRYFSIFAPRQSGKTTFFEETCKQLHNDPTYVAIILSFQDYKNIDKSQFYSLIQQELYEQLIHRLKQVNCEKTEEVQQFLDRHHITDHISFRLLFEELNRIIQFKKIVIFIDEFDGIPVTELENFLTSLRGLYQKYKKIRQKALKILLNERNDHFDNLYEKAKLYKETFVEIVFDHVEYNPDDEDQSWLEQYGLVKNKEGYAVVGNNIYKSRYIKTFFKEARAYDDLSLKTYE